MRQGFVRGEHIYLHVMRLSPGVLRYAGFLFFIRL
jgi:hypothetical protein